MDNVVEIKNKEVDFSDTSVEHAVINLMLNSDFWQDNKAKLLKGMFPDELSLVYDSIAEAHEHYNRDLRLDEVWGVLLKNNPTLTSANKSRLSNLFTEISKQPTPGLDVAKDLLHKMWEVEIGRQCAELSLKIMEGNQDAVQKLSALLDRNKDGLLEAGAIRYCDTELDFLLDECRADMRWRTNHPGLATFFPGVGPGTFAVYFARPEVGKTAFGVSLIAAPKGYLEQGARVMFIGNEEPVHRTVLRCISAHSGVVQGDMLEKKAFVKKSWDAIRSGLVVVDGHGASSTDVDALLLKHKPDILFIDQLDKLSIAGNFARKDQELGEVYEYARNSASIHNCAVFAASQASFEAEGKSIVEYSTMAESKTAKAGEVDLAIGIGKQNGTGNDERTRTICISKNKLTGKHGHFSCDIIPELSRYGV